MPTLTQTRPDATSTARRLQGVLPAARGPLSQNVIDALSGRQDEPRPMPVSVEGALADDDLQLALYCCYELHYRGFGGVDDRWEWDPSLLAVTRSLEEAVETCLRGDYRPRGLSAGQVIDELWAGARAGGPSLSAWLLENGTLQQAREIAIHRSAYQLKEADPHTWAIPRLTGRSKAAMVAIQNDEYGAGEVGRMHASLFADAMEALGLDAAYGCYLDSIPGVTLATTNLITFLGLHRRLRGALVGHLAVFEMNSVGPMGRYARWLRRLGVADAGLAFYDVHVVADAVHQHIAADELVGGLLDAEPDLADDVLFGAHAISLVEGAFAAHVQAAWAAGRSSLRTG